ncbi:DUF3986 family protein [Salipaludibacillus sp. LMS25]|jgi:hypothetical protein|uniref:DUF3986 family protein n=1 Tax=Salipaludibacillus sp. LMS25 TaxID=2924031 RepID=UPI0020D1B46A|nr:DUF3986 family protein [Salipaludibacillus sp. LMS25]UTR13933.1 DUF3986 family protein [Salipaludibacillus sp. LMS25]
MTLFDDNLHMHVGYYEDSNDIEGTFLKVKEKDIWCLFYNDDMYKTKIPNKSGYPFIDSFGHLVGIYFISKKELTSEKGNDLFKKFLDSI